MTRYTLITPPAALPVTVAEFLNYIKVEDDADLPAAEKTLAENMIDAATGVMESYLSRAIINQTWQASFDCWGGVWRCPHGILQSVTSLSIIADDGTETVQSASSYNVATGERGMVWQRTGYNWTTTVRAFDSMRLVYVAGYGASGAAVPEAIRTGIMQLAAMMYEQREVVDPSGVPSTIADRVRRYIIYGAA